MARYYFRRGAYVAAANRAQYAVQNYPQAPALEEAGFIMVKAYDALGMADLRDDARRVLEAMCLPPLSLLERRGHTAAATFHLSKGVAKELKGKAAYTRTRGLNPIRYAEMVREYLRDHRQIENAELRELLGLGNSASAQVEASRYLKKWSQPDGFLDRQRVRGTWGYTLRARA